MSSTQYQIDGSGALVAYADSFACVTDDMVAKADHVEFLILEAKSQIECSFTKLAFLLDVVEREQLYLAKGFATFELYCESPAIKIKKRLAQDLLRIQREVVPMLAETTDKPQLALAKAGVSNVRAMLPLLRQEEGEAKFVELLKDTPSLTWDDVRAE